MKTRHAPLPDTVAELQAQLLAERRLVPERLKLIEQLRHKIEAGAEQLTQKDTELTVKDKQLTIKDEQLKSQDEKLKEKDQKIAELQETLTNFWEQLRLMKLDKFGRSSEQCPQQGDLFNEAEAILDADEADDNSDDDDDDTQTITYERRKPKRKSLPENLPRETIVHDVEDKHCDCCGHELHKIGEDISEKLEIIPAQLKVIEHVRPKYACSHCEQFGTENHIKQQKMPKCVIDKGIATPSLLSFIITNKYQYSLPLYRQSVMLEQFDIELSYKTMSEWMLKCSSFCELIYNYWHQTLLKQDHIFADETTHTVNSVDKANCYMWVYCCGADSPPENTHENSPPHIVLFDYHDSRKAQCSVDFLDGFEGYLQVDGYQAYEKTKAKLVGCWAHGRRGFVKAIKLQPKGKTGKANQGLSFIQKLYAIESKLKGKSAAEKYRVRQQQSKPILETFKKWLEKAVNQTLPKSTLGKAIKYCLNQWDKLVRYLEDGRLNIDNNRAERANKAYVIGRKNWMFSQTERGAKASAILYSLVETAKANGVNVYDYIIFLFEELVKKPTDLEPLMPWNFAKR